jgi:hypothetical protein
MADVFHSARLTLVRAQHRFNEFDRAVRDFVEDKPWTYTVDNQTEPGTDIHKIEFTRRLPEMLPCILFDAVNNLRAVLDQAGYAAAVAGKSKSTKSVKFPFGPTEADWRRNLDGGCKDLPPSIRAFFETFKSYKGGNDTLWALNEIANAKKHLALLPLRIGQGWATIYTTGEMGQGFFTGPDIGWNPSKDEMILMKCSPSDPKLKVDGHFTFSVAIGGIDVVASQQAVHVLQSMSSMAESILLGTEAECRRLGFETGET